MLVTAPDPGLRRVAVDLTLMEPGAGSGGAKLVTLTLLRELSALAPGLELILLTNARTHAELSLLDAPNVRRVCVWREPELPKPATAAAAYGRTALRAALARVLPPEAVARLRSRYWQVVHRTTRTSVLRPLGADLLFCPVGAPSFLDPAVPIVAVIYDLQHLRYPEFFDPEQRYFRQQHFERICQHAARVACISEYVRGTVLTHASLPPERVTTIPLPLLHAMRPLPSSDAGDLLARLHLQRGQFLLYPANFWRHKNHHRLLVAFHQFRQTHADSPLVLVCTGAPGADMQRVQREAEAIGIAGSVRFPGHVTSAALATLLDASAALIYPSLYEGFGMPLLEAMALGKPIMCSNVASLPEVAHDAAVYFDPTAAADIARAIERWAEAPGLTVDLARRGKQRVAAFGTAASMAQQYLDLFSAVGREHPLRAGPTTMRPPTHLSA